MRSSPVSADDSTQLAHQKRRHTDLAWSFPSDPSASDPSFTAVNPTLPAGLKQSSRNYSLSLAPSLVPSVSPLIDTLVASGVSRYSTFRMLESTAIYDSQTGTGKRVPGSKEDVFKDKDVGLVDKRRLMKVLLWMMGEFEGSSEIRGQSERRCWDYCLTRTDFYLCLLIGKEDTPMLDFLQSSFSLSKKLAEALTFALAHCTSASGES